MLDVVTKPDTKAQRIERELLDNPERSDREIARFVGCDHKTVGSARARMSDLLAVDSPPISPASASREELLLRTLPPGFRDSPLLKEQLDRISAWEELDRRDGFNPDPFGPGNPELVILSQPATVVYLNEYDQVCIRQAAESDQDDQYMRFTRTNLPALIERLTSFLDKSQS